MPTKVGAQIKITEPTQFFFHGEKRDIAMMK